MDGAWLTRMHWRRRGAWLWPAFAAATVADALVGSALPASGETQDLLGAALAGCFLNLIGVLLLSAPVAATMRRLRPDLPKVVARNYAGTLVVSSVTAVLLAAGLIHRPAVIAHQRAMRDAISRAQAFIGDRAPAEFRRNLQTVSTFPIEPGAMYRICVPSLHGGRTYCVIVKTALPFAQSVSFAGYESNSVFAAGAN